MMLKIIIFQNFIVRIRKFACRLQNKNWFFRYIMYLSNDESTFVGRQVINDER
jgi:hypothetical protein